MSSDSLKARIELLEKEISSLTAILAKEYKDNVILGVDNIKVYMEHKGKLANLEHELISARELICN